MSDFDTPYIVDEAVSERMADNMANAVSGLAPFCAIAEAIERDRARWDREAAAIVVEVEQRGGLDDNFSPGCYESDLQWAVNELRKKMFAHYVSTLDLDAECEEFDFASEARMFVEANT